MGQKWDEADVESHEASHGLWCGWEGWNISVLCSLPAVHPASTNKVQLVPSVLSPATPPSVPEVLKNDTCVKFNSNMHFLLHIIFWGKKKNHQQLKKKKLL